MIGTIEIKVNAARPNLPLSPMFAFKDSPSSLRIMEVPKKIVDWNITEVNAVVHYPDNTTNTFPATRLGNVWVVTFNGCSITGRVVNGLEILADGIDENGDAVNGYVLGVGDIYILDRDAEVEEAVSKSTLKYCDVMPETPVTGDVFIGSGALEIYDGTQWISIDIDLSEYATKSEVETSVSTLDSKIDSTKTDLEGSIAEVASDIPTTTSELENDSGFITSASVPTKTSELTNDSNFITSAQVEPSTGYGMTGYAANSDYATRLKALDIGTTVPTDRGTIIPTLAYDSATNTYTLELLGSVAGYWAWDLHRLFGTDFSPMIRLEWRKGSIYRKRVIGGRVIWAVTYNNNWMWVAQGQYAITCPTGDGKPDGKFYVLNYEDETHPNYINDPATDVHTITYGNNDITSIDGQVGGQTSQAIWCTRTSEYPIAIWERPFAYRNELPTKVSDLTNDAGYLTTVSWNDVQDKPFIPTKTSDLTNDSDFTTNTALNNGLALKQDKLSNAQVSAIDSVVDERKTIVTYNDGTVAQYDIIGKLQGDVNPSTGTPIPTNQIPNVTNVRHIVIGSGVTEIVDMPFIGCHILSITLPDNGLVLGQLAFAASNLDYFTIPQSVTEIGYDAFAANTGIEDITFVGKDIYQVQEMSNYPWGITDTSIIKTWNAASKEWVLEQIAALRAELQGGN